MFCVNLSKNLVHFVLDLPCKVFGLIGSLCRDAPHGILPGHHQNRYPQQRQDRRKASILLRS